MTAKLFEAALGIAAPWSVNSVEFDEGARVLTVLVDFKPGTHFAIAGHEGTHPVHDTVSKTYRHLNFFQHECHLHVRTPRVKLPNGSVRLVEPDFAGRLSGFRLLFEALVLMLAQQMPFCGRRTHRGRVRLSGHGSLQSLRRDGVGAGRLQRSHRTGH